MAQRLPEPDPDAVETDDEPSHPLTPELADNLVDEKPARPAGNRAAAVSSTAVTPITTLQRYLAEVRRYPFLSKEEELALFREYQTKDSREAAVKLILSNLRVSVSIAAEYLHTGADHMDLIQEGNVGLMQAIKKFDPTKNVRFHAYAAWWVRAYILRYLLNTHRLVKVGTTQDQRKLFYNLRKEKAKLEREGFTPDAKLLADRLHVSERDVVEMDQRMGSWEVSLDQPLKQDNDGGTLLDILPAQEAPADEQLASLQLRRLFRKKLAEFSKTLPERDEDILRNRILSETPVTLEDLGHKYGITKERTRQLEARLIDRLRDYIKKDVADFDYLRS
ncbi:MAG: RNA polymerase subunit sigma-70 [Nitrospirae bacterium RIFCSPLOWO2_12_FULL_63_8]|nr:MAG: RNA polymerase subunit sigma-70 [Nitrospirae bacterium RIFCSPLOWO2_12_FULL_63_8]